MLVFKRKRMPPEEWISRLRGILSEIAARKIDQPTCIGAIGISAWASPRSTKDLDFVVPSWDKRITDAMKKLGYLPDPKNAESAARNIFWMRRGSVQNAIEFWVGKIVEKKLDDGFWTHATSLKIGGLKLDSVISREDLIATKIGHELIEVDDRIDVTNILNKYSDVLDYAYLAERLCRWKLHNVFFAEMFQNEVLPQIKGHIQYSPKAVYSRVFQQLDLMGCDLSREIKKELEKIGLTKKRVKSE